MSVHNPEYPKFITYKLPVIEKPPIPSYQRWLEPNWGCRSEQDIDREVSYRSAQIAEYMAATGNLHGSGYGNAIARLHVIADRERAELPNGPFVASAKSESSDQPSANVPSPSFRRAVEVATVHKELTIIRPHMFSEADYEGLRAKHPDFLVFIVAQEHALIKTKVCAIQDHTQYIRLSQEVVAAKHGKQLSTVQTDWKKHKPRETGGAS